MKEWPIEKEILAKNYFKILLDLDKLITGKKITIKKNSKEETFIKKLDIRR